MPEKLVFISARRQEMREFREAAEAAIEAAGMRHIYVEPGTVKRSVKVARQIEESVRSADVFVGLYGYTLDSNPRPSGYDKHYLELEFGWAQEAGRTCLYYAPESEGGEFATFYDAPERRFDRDMLDFRKALLEYGVGWLTTPQALYDDLLGQLGALSPRVFISYSSEDLEFVEALYKRLTESGYRPWFNFKNIAVAEEWLPALMKGLEETSIIVLVVSPAAMGSEWVRVEWEKFLESKKPIIQLVYRETVTPPALKAIQGIKVKEDGQWYFDLLREIEARL